MQPSKMPHIAELDGIRAIAIALVFLSHAGLGSWIPGGLGVTIFFFLSGYLITSLMVVEQNTFGSVSISGFYLRRILRIIPPMWIAMLVAALLVWTGLITAAIDPLAVLLQVFFLINYAGLWIDTQGVPGIPLWSLAVEEHFYILFPLIFILVLSRMTARRAAAWCLLICAAVLMMRLVSVFGYNDLFHTYYWSHTRADAILFGCCLALWNNPVLDPENAWKPRTTHFVLACGALLASIAFRSDIFRETVRYTIQGAALYVLFSYVLHRPRWVSSILNLAIAQRIGLYSYTIYLIHVPVLIAIAQNLPTLPTLAQSAVGAMISIAFAAGMYEFVEHPLAKLRKRLHKKVPPAAVPLKPSASLNTPQN